MSPIQWYYAHGDQHAGPVAPAQLKALADSGELLPDDLVWREGMAEWVAARNVRGLFNSAPSKEAKTPPKPIEPFDDAVQPVSPMPTSSPAVLPVPGRVALDHPRPSAARHAFDLLLEGARVQFTAQFIDATTKVFTACGHYCLYAAMLLGFGLAVALGVETDTFDPVLRGTIWLLSFALLQYAAARCCVALDRLNRTTSGKVNTTVLLDSFALFSMVAGLGILLGSAVLAVRSDTYSLVLAGLLLFIVCEFLAFVSLNPQSLSISVTTQSRAAEEAIGVLSFLFKAMMRLAPVAFGVGVVCGTLWLFYACYLALAPPAGREAVEVFLGAERLTELEAATDPASVAKMLDIWPAQATASTATWWITAFAALPFVAYILFLLGNLFLESLGGLLSIPGKLDLLSGDQDDQEEEPDRESLGRRADDR